ncbi:MAG: energy-coupling factor transporter substrate-binding protein [Aeromicrobium sp.]|nr:energy-coupling factor transporter substrate-binding protein [Aeromicrobium sp.]
MRGRRRMPSVLLLVGIVAIFALAMVLGSTRADDSGETFVGSDSAATAQIEQDNPGYKPWFTPVFSPSSGEVESGLFALQAAAGAGVLGYVIGVMRGRRRAEAAAVVRPDAA